MKKCIILSALLFSFLSIHAQSEKTVKIYLKSAFDSHLYQQTSNGISFINEHFSGSLQGFSAAIMTTRENATYSEWELSDFRTGLSRYSREATDTIGSVQLTEGRQIGHFYTSFRYEYGFHLNRLLGAPHENISYTLGLALNPYMRYSRLIPFTSNEFGNENFFLGTKVQFIPRIILGGKRKCYVDFNFPISLIDASFSKIRRDDPTLPVGLRRFWQGDVIFFPFDLQARVGLGIRI